MNQIYLPSSGSVPLATKTQRKRRTIPSVTKFHPTTTTTTMIPTRRRRWTRPSALAISSAAAAAAAPPPLLIALSPVQGWLLTIAACVLAGAAAFGLILAIPSILAMRRSMKELNEILATVKSEIPRTASVLRLSGLEVADAVEEVTGLTTDLSAGIRSTAQMMTMTEETIKSAPATVKSVVKDVTPAAQKLLESQLKLNATLEHQAQVAKVTKTTARRARGLLRAGWAAQWASGVYNVARTVAEEQRLTEGLSESLENLSENLSEKLPKAALQQKNKGKKMMMYEDDEGIDPINENNVVVVKKKKNSNKNN